MSKWKQNKLQDAFKLDSDEPQPVLIVKYLAGYIMTVMV